MNVEARRVRKHIRIVVRGERRRPYHHALEDGRASDLGVAGGDAREGEIALSQISCDALLAARLFPVRDKAKKRWVYAGHVGTGFDQASLKSIHERMQPLRIDKKQFDQKVGHENATTWLVPKLVGEVKFTEWTSDSEMRHPVFLGFRADKKATDVVREQA
jgi:hypothetical protein